MYFTSSFSCYQQESCSNRSKAARSPEGVSIFVFNNTYSCFLGEGKGTQYSCLENPMDGGAWWAAVHGVSKSQTWLSDFTFTFHFSALEKEMATHSSVLAWRIPGTGSHRVRHDWSDLAAAAAAAIVACFPVSILSPTLILDLVVRVWFLKYNQYSIPLFFF